MSRRSMWILLLTVVPILVGAQHPNGSPEYRSMEQKIAYLEQNAARPHPDSKPVQLTDAEANAYFNQGGVRLPKGVSNVHVTAKPGQIDGIAQVDFEQIMQHRGDGGALSSLFSGQHQVHAISQASGASGVGTIRVQTVELDGIQIPEFALEWFVEHYLSPKYKNVGLTSTFKLPLRIDSAVVEAGKVRLVQR